MDYQVTVRYGAPYQRYHTYAVEEDDIRDALRSAAENLPEDIAAEADLVELRPAPDPDARRYVAEVD